MAARRLIIILLVLLGISTLLAAQLPDQTSEEDEQGSETTTATATTAQGQTGTTPTAKVPRGEGTSATITVDPKKVSVVPVSLGDQLALTVKSAGEADLVEIPALGLFDAVSPEAPATFDLFADRAGDYGIRLVEADRLVGRIEVRPRARGESGQAPARARP